MDWIIAEEERTYMRLLELRDKFKAVVAELDRAGSPAAELPNISQTLLPYLRVFHGASQKSTPH
jgi:hypothetical protein